jgi:uncharacterized protein YndB with AHSA1/START domain
VEHGSIEREVQIDASPATVFEVISSPEHLQEWWPDEAHFEPTPGATGELVFGDRASGTAHVPQITVVEVVPSSRFSFRWIHSKGEVAREGNSLFVTFDLTPNDGGTLLRMSESGFREMGWEVAVLEEQYDDHTRGWDRFIPRLVRYATSVEAGR